MKIVAFWVAVLLPLHAVHAQQPAKKPTMVKGIVETGSASVAPDWGISGEYGTWTVTYTVGEHGIAAGGGIRVQLPDEWHAGPRNSAVRLQATDPKDECYVQAQTSNGGATLKTVVEEEREHRLIKHAKFSLDGRYERYVFVVRVIVDSGRLNPGDTISLVYGDTSGGSKGYLAAAVSAPPLPILIAVDPEGDNRFQLIASRPAITSRPGRVVETQLHGPSQGIVGEPVRMRISFVDKEDNAAPTSKDMRLIALTGSADLSILYSFATSSGSTEFEVTPTEEGVFRLRAETEDGRLIAVSNPMLVARTLPARPLYWGELHSHTKYSWDGVGTGSFMYARQVSGLDFYTMTDHSMEPQQGHTRGLAAAYWDEYTALTDDRNEPGRFVTLHAYECSFGRPFGHHIVYFRGAPGVLQNPTTSILPKLWDALEAGNALTIPHHTGKFPSGVDFSFHDPRFRRNFEMYSGHGLSETYDPTHNLSFENSVFTSDSKSLDTPTHIQDVWMQGLMVSAVAASDDHRAHPGMPHYGLTAVRADSLTREGIFQALYNKRTYATTGAKIIMDFTADGNPTGEVVALSDAPELRLVIHGTDALEWVEILRYRPGDEDFLVIQRWEPDEWDFEGRFTDPDFVPGTIYYARVKQVRSVRGRWAMAWSTPIWTAK